MANFNAIIAVETTEIVSREMSVTVKWADLSDDIKGQLMIHGLIQKVSDAASGAAREACALHFGSDDFSKADAKAWMESPSGKKAVQETSLRMMQKAVDALLAGRWKVREGSGTVEKKTPLQSLVLEIAKGALRTVFDKACMAKGVKPTFAEYVKLSPAVAKYFDDSGKRPVWKDDAVLAYVDAQKDSGKRDIVAEAEEQLRKNATLAADLEVDEMLADI